MSRRDLFREEVLEARRCQWLGSVRLAAPVSHEVWAICAIAVAAVIAAWLYSGHYTRRERVAGQLVPSAGLLTVQSPTLGSVVRLYIRQGETVRRGEPLVEISGERNSAALGPTQALIGAELRAQNARLESQLADQKRSGQQQAASLETTLAILRQEAAQIAGQIVLEQKQAATAREMLEKMRPLSAKGYVSGLQLQQHEANLLQTQSRIKALRRQRLETHQQAEQIQHQLRQLPLELAAKRTATQRDLSLNGQQLAQNELQRDAVLVAPADGVISSLLVKPGQTVTAEQPLLSVLPEGSVLQAQLLVPSSAIGFVREGTSVVLHYQAFPYQKFGVHHGKVIEISRSALSADESARLLGGQPPPVPLYKVQVAVGAQEVLTYGEPSRLMPGMAFDADLLLDRRRLIEWIFEPLYGMSKRGGENG